MIVKAEISNPNEIRIKVEIDLRLYEWQEIIKIIEDRRSEIGFYGPLNNTLLEINHVIKNITKREEIKTQDATIDQ